MELSSHIIELFGVREFLADIDRDRQFWRDGRHVISDVLDYAAGPGFGPLAKWAGLEWASAQEYRQRYLIGALAELSKQRPFPGRR